MNVVRWSGKCIVLVIGLLSVAALAADSSSPPREAIDYLRTEIESRRAELAEIGRERTNHKATTDRRIVALRAVNAALKKDKADLEKAASRREESAAAIAVAQSAGIADLRVMLERLSGEVKSLRMRVDPTFRPKSDVEPPSASQPRACGRPATKGEKNPFD